MPDKKFEDGLKEYYGLIDRDKQRVRNEEIKGLKEDVDDSFVNYFINKNGAHKKNNKRAKSYFLKGENKHDEGEDLINHLVVEHIGRRYKDKNHTSLYKEHPHMTESYVNQVLSKHGVSYEHLLKELKDHEGSIKDLLNDDRSVLRMLLNELPRYEHDEEYKVTTLRQDLLRREQDGDNLSHAKDFFKSTTGEGLEERVRLDETLGLLGQYRTEGDRFTDPILEQYANRFINPELKKREGKLRKLVDDSYDKNEQNKQQAA